VHIVIADSLPASAADSLRAAGWYRRRSGRKPTRSRRSRQRRRADRPSATQVTRADRRRAESRVSPGRHRVDNVDVPAATARGILVMNAAGANSISVAELTVGLMLALARMIPAADASMKQGVWDKKRFMGTELRGQKLGVIGFGRIGREVAGRAKAFGMEILAYDPFFTARAADAAGVTLVDLDQIVEQADVISLHVPALPETRHLINAARLKKMKKGVRIVNTARGELIDEAALADAIESGHVAGAGLDVFETEPPPDKRLQSLPQVVATPHIAGVDARSAGSRSAPRSPSRSATTCSEGVIRNAVNFPSVPQDDVPMLRPYLQLGQKLGSLVAQLLTERPTSVGHPATTVRSSRLTRM
jgi:D-3-phosphoglycerate dehydrogenase